MDPYVVALFASALWPRRDSPKRAAKLARKYQDGRVVFLPGWLRAEGDADEVPGLFAARKGDPMWWRPRGLGRSAIALTVEGVIDPPLANLTDERDPTTSRFWFAWGPEREPLIVRIDDPYGTEFLPLLEGHGSVISFEASFEPPDEGGDDEFGAVRVDDCLICGAPASWIHELDPARAVYRDEYGDQYALPVRVGTCSRCQQLVDDRAQDVLVRLVQDRDPESDAGVLVTAFLRASIEKRPTGQD